MENRGHHFQIRNRSGAEGGGEALWATQTYLGAEVEGEETLRGTVTHGRARGRHNTEGGSASEDALYPPRGLQSSGPLVTRFALGNRATLLRPALAASLSRRSELDFEFCGLCGHGGPRGLEERLEDGVRVHFGRRVG